MQTAVELLDQLKALPDSEQAASAEMFVQWRIRSESATEAEIPLTRWPDAAARRRAIFGEAVLPNMVLETHKQERY